MALATAKARPAPGTETAPPASPAGGADAIDSSPAKISATDKSDQPPASGGGGAGPAGDAPGAGPAGGEPVGPAAQFKRGVYHAQRAAAAGGGRGRRRRSFGWQFTGFVARPGQVTCCSFPSDSVHVPLFYSFGVRLSPDSHADCGGRGGKRV